MPRGKRAASRRADRRPRVTTPSTAQSTTDSEPTHLCPVCSGVDLAPECTDGIKRKCFICYRQKPTSEVLALRRCKHQFCSSCLTHYFKWALDEERIFPAKCCRMPIRLQDAEPCIPDKVAKQYKAKMAECAAVDRTYCHVPTCSALISKYMTYNKQAVCPKCMASTCPRCKLEWHDGLCVVVEDPLLMQLARVMNWRQCPQCHSLVERTEGCRHMP